MIQVIIFVTEGLAMWLSQQSKIKWQRYAPIVGLTGEPFWIYDSLIKESWGILGLSVIYTIIWSIGINTHWINPKSKLPTR